MRVEPSELRVAGRALQDQVGGEVEAAIAKVEAAKDAATATNLGPIAAAALTDLLDRWHGDLSTTRAAATQLGSDIESPVARGYENSDMGSARQISGVTGERLS